MNLSLTGYRSVAKLVNTLKFSTCEQSAGRRKGVFTVANHKTCTFFYSVLLWTNPEAEKKCPRISQINTNSFFRWWFTCDGLGLDAVGIGKIHFISILIYWRFAQESLRAHKLWE